MIALLSQTFDLIQLSHAIILTGNTPIKSVVLCEMNENEIVSELYGFHSFLSKINIASVLVQEYLHIDHENHMN